MRHSLVYEGKANKKPVGAIGTATYRNYFNTPSLEGMSVNTIKQSQKEHNPQTQVINIWGAIYIFFNAEWWRLILFVFVLLIILAGIWLLKN